MLGGAPVRWAEWLRARPRPVVAIVLLIAPAFLLRDAILGTGALYQRDIHLYWHAEAEAFVRAVAAGSWPVWDRTVGFGQPLLANSSAQVLYPLTWLNLLVRPWWYYTFFVVTHLVLSAAGMYVACRRLDCSRIASLTSAVLWTACGPFLSFTILWHHFAGAAWMTWVLAAALHLGSARTTRAALGLAAVLAAQVLAGSFDMAAMGGLTAAAAILWRLSWPRPWQAAPDRALLAHAVMACALAIGLSAAQWMPTMELALRTGRRALPRETRTYWSVHPISIADLVFPGFSGIAPVSENVKKALFEDREPFLASLYLGLPAAGLVVAGFLDRRRRGAVFLAAAGIVALLFALGRHTPVYDAIVTALPPLQAFRYPVKAMVLAALSWCVLAGMGVDFLRMGNASTRRAWLARWAAIGAALMAAAGAAGLAAAGVDRGARHLAMAAFMGFVGAWFVARALRGHGARTAPAVAAAMTAVLDLMLYHRSLNGVSPIDLYTHRPEAMLHLDQGPDARLYAYDYSVPGATGARAPDAQVHRLARLPAGWSAAPAVALAQQMALTPLAGSRWGRLGSFEVDYTGLVPVHMNQAAYLLRAMEGSPSHLRLLQMAAVNNVVARHEAPFTDLRPVAVVPGLFEAPIRVFAVPDPSPHAFVVARTRVGEGMSGVVALMDPLLDFRHEALIPAKAPGAHGTAPGTARIVAAQPDRLKLVVDAPDGGYLVVLETYDPGWRATVDGGDATVVPANILFRGVQVAAGAHTVEMVYRPPGVVAGLVVSLLSMLAASALAWRTSPSRGAAREARP